MRCLTLADGLRQRSAQIRFISRHLPGHFRDILAAKGHEFMSLGNDSCQATPDHLAHASWLGTSQHADAQASIHALSDQVWDWLIVDHYALDASWESAHRETARNILAIDDLADRRHDCDVLLDQNFYADMETRYTGKLPENCRSLLGPEYALLRDEFCQLHEQVKPRTGSVKRLLVFFGGVDADNYTGCAVEALVNLGIKGLHVDVVIGAQHPHREQIELACTEHNFDCHVQTKRMAELMAVADLAVGAGGSATWERCCLGLPAFVICTAKNQIRQVADAASEGLLYAPEIRGQLSDAIRRHICTLMENEGLRLSIARKAMQAVDGRGVLRAVANLDCGSIEIRIAGQRDSKRLFEWRNHPAIRAVSRSTCMINWEDHQSWFASVLNDPDRMLLIGQREGLSVGVVRFDIEGDEAEISIYLVPNTKQAGLGTDLLRNAERWLAANRPDVRKLRADVLGGNERSRRLFIRAGYRVESTTFSKRLD